MAAVLAAVAVIVTVSMPGVVSPGPMFAVTVATSSEKGFRAGPLVALGHIMVEIPFVTALWIGLSEVLKLEIVDFALSLLGGIFLTYLGIRSFRKRPAKEGPTIYDPLVGGMVTTAFNPLFIAWWIALGPALISLTAAWGLSGLALLLLAHCPLNLVWCSFISASISKGKRFLSERAMSLVVYACGCILLGFGAYFLLRVILLVLS